jgi:hypothetical protein
MIFAVQLTIGPKYRGMRMQNGMREEQAREIIRNFLNADTNRLPCHIESLRFIAGNPQGPIQKSEWAAVIAFDVDEDHDAHFSSPIVSVDDETSEVSLLESL